MIEDQSRSVHIHEDRLSFLLHLSEDDIFPPRKRVQDVLRGAADRRVCRGLRKR